MEDIDRLIATLDRTNEILDRIDSGLETIIRELQDQTPNQQRELIHQKLQVLAERSGT